MLFSRRLPDVFAALILFALIVAAAAEARPLTGSRSPDFAALILFALIVTASAEARRCGSPGADRLTVKTAAATPCAPAAATTASSAAPAPT